MEDMKLGTLLSMAAMAVMGMALALPAQAADPIKIGVYLPLTGQNAFGGQLHAGRTGKAGRTRTACKKGGRGGYGRAGSLAQCVEQLDLFNFGQSDFCGQ